MQLSDATAELLPELNTDELISAKKMQEKRPEQEKVSDYFAACPPEDIAEELEAKVDKYFSFLISSNLAELWRKSYRAYYGMKQSDLGSGWGVFDVGNLMAAGDQGEIVHIKVNHFANLITHQYSTVTTNRPALTCRATNSDADSLVSAQLGDGVVEYFFREKKIENNLNLAKETGLVLSEGFIVLSWDPTAGKKYGVGPNGAPVFDGDIVTRNFTPFQMVRDVNKNSSEEQTWYITVSKRNKYDLMAKYPDLAEEIDKVSSESNSSKSKNFSDPSKIVTTTTAGDDDDDIPYKEFLHKVTDAMPQGRYTIFVNGNIRLYDGPLPFREMPVYRVTPKNIIGTPFGWTLAFDILALQELVDKLYSVVSTNILGTGVSNFWSPPNNGVSVSQLSSGMNLIESMVKPEVLDLLRTPAEVYKFIDKIESVMETLAGVSEINRGGLPSADMSGSAMAFMASQAITFSNGMQSSSNMLDESVGTGLVNILKDFAATPRLAVIAGKQNRPQMKMFMGKDLEPISNVVCDEVAALSKTTSGKIAIADNLLKAGLVPTAQEYLTLIKTGQMEPMTRGPVMENILIQLENEELLQGQLPPVLRTDNHAQHIQEHKTLLSSPSSRRDPRIVVPTLQHIQEHEDMQKMMQMTDPAFLAVTGQQPLPFPEAPQQPQGGQPPIPQQAQGGEMAGAAAAINPQDPSAQRAAKIKGPNMPSLPKGTDPQTQAAYQKLNPGA